FDKEEAYPHSAFERAWKQLLLNQFHDILPGSSLKEVYDLALQQQEDSLRTFIGYARRSRNKLAEMIAHNEKDVVVFNTLGHHQSGLCKLPDSKATSIYNEQGARLPSFHDGTSLWFYCAEVPPKGWQRLSLGVGDNEAPAVFSWKDLTLETPYYLAVFSPNGSLARLYDKEACCEVLVPGGKGNALTLSVDYPKEYDAWNIGKQGKDMRYRIDVKTSFSVVTNHALAFTLQWAYQWGKSRFTQQATFYAHTRRIDFSLECDYQEDHLMLRTEFDVDVCFPRASYDIAFGVCERTTHTNTSWDEAQFEVPAHKWVDLSDESYGVALLSKQNYGYSAKGHTLSLSLLRTPTYPNREADRGMHQFSYALYPHKGRFQEAKVIEEGYNFHQPLLVVKPEQVRNILPAEASLVSCPDEGIVIETVKKSEDRNSLILRILQLNGKRVKSHLHSLLPIFEAYQCNLLEERLVLLTRDDEGVALSLRPHEIQTVELVLQQ
ncbi:MAG: glycoside hydrolase family 38 C-terminal domain-containing protein, partial [Sphaerochaetaceae bacterium]